MRRAALAIALFLTGPVAAQQPRDGRPPGPPPAGTSIIWGVVVTDERQPKPLRRARVTLGNAEIGVERTAITNDDGTFTFDRLPGGRYSVRAAKDAYVAMFHGARRPGATGARIELGTAEAQRITLRLPRGSVITGAVFDAEGHPASGIEVVALAFRSVGGERRLVPAGPSTSSVGVTDDRGIYRVFGLPPGDYVIGARVRRVPGPSELQVVSEAEVRRALAEIRAPAAPSLPGIPNPQVPAPAITEPRRTVVYAPVYYPGVTDVAAATKITLGPAEERTGFDFTVRYVPTATISGFVSGGTAPPSISLARMDDQLAREGARAGRADTLGAFSFSSIPPGRYVLLARNQSLWALTEVAVNGEDVGGIAMSLQPGITISGTVAFEGTSPPPPTLAGFRVPLPASLSNGSTALGLPPLELEASGRFAIRNIVPGRYRIGLPMRGDRTPVGPWWLKSIVMNGRDVLDGPLELRQSADDAVVTFSDRATELSGTVLDQAERPLSNLYVVVFGRDPASWFFNSRRVAAATPDARGRYVINNLPPGDYFITSDDDLEQGEWFDPDVLKKLASTAQPFRLGEYERKTYDLVIGQR